MLTTNAARLRRSRRDGDRVLEPLGMSSTEPAGLALLPRLTGTVRHMRRCMVVACAILVVCAAPAVSGTTAGADTPAHMRAIVREWSKRLNAGDNRGIAQLFSLPAIVIQG